MGKVFFDERPAGLWNARIESDNVNCGVWNHQFGFTISGTSNIIVVVDATVDLANPTWTPLATNTLTGDSMYFSDPQWTYYPSRYCRLRWP